MLMNTCKSFRPICLKSSEQTFVGTQFCALENVFHDRWLNRASRKSIRLVIRHVQPVLQCLESVRRREYVGDSLFQHEWPIRMRIKSAQMRRRTGSLKVTGAMIGCVLFTAGVSKPSRAAGGEPAATKTAAERTHASAESVPYVPNAREPGRPQVVSGREIRHFCPLGRLQRALAWRVGDEQRENVEC